MHFHQMLSLWQLYNIYASLPCQTTNEKAPAPQRWGLGFVYESIEVVLFTSLACAFLPRRLWNQNRALPESSTIPNKTNSQKTHNLNAPIPHYKEPSLPYLRNHSDTATFTLAHYTSPNCTTLQQTTPSFRCQESILPQLHHCFSLLWSHVIFFDATRRDSTLFTKPPFDLLFCFYTHSLFYVLILTLRRCLLESIKSVITVTDSMVCTFKSLRILPIFSSTDHKFSPFPVTLQPPYCSIKFSNGEIPRLSMAEVSTQELYILVVFLIDNCERGVYILLNKITITITQSASQPASHNRRSVSQPVSPSFSQYF